MSGLGSCCFEEMVAELILDADLSASCRKSCPCLLYALASGEGEFVNGSRLVYPPQRYAMKFTNMIGNKLFGLTFSFLLDQRIKDTLCGTRFFTANG